MMMNPYGIPEVSVQEVATRRTAGDPIILLDVREPYELNAVQLGADVEMAPLSELATLQEDALPESVMADKEAEIIVICHHGQRSLQAAAWLKMKGWSNVASMAGGVHAYAMQIDPSIGFY